MLGQYNPVLTHIQYFILICEGSGAVSANV